MRSDRSSDTLAAVEDPGAPNRRGWFITVEGPDGAGKTTQAAGARHGICASAVCDSLLTREPGGTPLGERIRELLLARTGFDRTSDPLTDALLFNAARAPARRRGDAAGARRRRGRWSAPATPTPRSPTRAPAPACRSTSCASLERFATGGLRPGPDDPSRPARSRPGSAGRPGRRHPLRGGLRPRLPRARPGRVPGLAADEPGPVRRRRRDARRATVVADGGRARRLPI